MNDRCNFDKRKMLNITLIGMFSTIDLLTFYVFSIITYDEIIKMLLELILNIR